jgi:Polyketide cyclase / dehydrase and lipid transport
MPTDTASRSIEVAAPLDRVLTTLRDVGSQARWVPEIRESEVLSRNTDGSPATARFRASTPVGTDEYTLAYQHRGDGLSWSLVEGKLQSAQDARYDLRQLDDDHTEVSFDLRITHGLPLPGFVRRRVLAGLVLSTLTGLKTHIEG